MTSDEALGGEDVTQQEQQHEPGTQCPVHDDLTTDCPICQEEFEAAQVRQGELGQSLQNLVQVLMSKGVQPPLDRIAMQIRLEALIEVLLGQGRHRIEFERQTMLEVIHHLHDAVSEVEKQQSLIVPDHLRGQKPGLVDKHGRRVTPRG